MELLYIDLIFARIWSMLYCDIFYIEYREMRCINLNKLSHVHYHDWNQVNGLRDIAWKLSRKELLPKKSIVENSIIVYNAN